MTTVKYFNNVLPPPTMTPSTLSPAARVWLILLLIVAGTVTLCRDAAAQPPQIVKWEIEATVYDIVDPLGIFPEVRLGDPVRGTLKYDLTLLPNPLYSGDNIYVYTNEIWFDVATMVIENPRTGNEMRFAKDMAGDFAYVEVVNDRGDEDSIYAAQPVLPLAGVFGTAPRVAVALFGPSTTISDLSLPAQLDLNDWPLAVITVFDLTFGIFGTYIDAEIYSLTPVEVPLAPGDFDCDGDVDFDDIDEFVLGLNDPQEYKNQIGLPPEVKGDTDGDGDIDFDDIDDFVAILSATDSAEIETVPEPGTAVLLYFGVVLFGLHRWRRRRCGSPERSYRFSLLSGYKSNNVQAPFDPQFLFHDCHEHVNADRDPHLGLHCVVAGAVESFDSQMLL